MFIQQNLLNQDNDNANEEVLIGGRKDIKYFDAFKEVLAPDELLDYKGVHFKMGMSVSRFTNLYGCQRPKISTVLSRKIYASHYGGESKY